jgi:small-conductance mechanosensitive channel
VSWLPAASEAIVLVPVAFIASWIARTLIRTLTRRAARRAQHRTGSWRVRLDRMGDNGTADDRKRQRADAVARMLGHLVTAGIFGLCGIAALELMGVSVVFAVSSAGFIGVAIALSGQDLVKDVGDDVVLHVGGHDVHGTVDLVGSASVRLRTPDGATWHAGHNAIESVTNLSQLPAVSDVSLPVDEWARADRDAAVERLAGSSNDVGLTGVVFVRDIETHEETAPVDGTVTVRVKSNRPLDAPQTDVVRDRLLDR